MRMLWQYCSLLSTHLMHCIAAFYSDQPDSITNNSGLSYSFILAAIASVMSFITAGLACGMAKVD